ncbi:SdrD B-like domain-containing protein, partial [Spirosoma endbachense]|uniref:SdrD B-like domain-containing protein n=1 Tax=Spirosoma endbachense TaxID=2666025 RepID=UPI0018E0AA0C
MLRPVPRRLRAIWLLFSLAGLFSPILAQAQCPTIQSVSSSSCYYVGGQSRATVSATIVWDNTGSGDITVQLSTLSGTPIASRTFKTGTFTQVYTANYSGQQTILSPQVIAFEVPADGSTGRLSVSRGSCPTSTFQTLYTAPSACPPTACPANTLGGTVFYDFDANGIQATGETAGVQNVTVTAFPRIGSPVSTTTDAFGIFSLTIPTSAYPVRLEYSNIPAFLSGGKSGPNGTSSRTTVQFISAPTCTASLGVLNQNEFCETNPLLTTPCYTNGDPLGGGNSGTDPAIVGFNYNSAGRSGPETFMIEGSEVGATWAMAYNKFTKRLFASATVKRHVGLGPQGIGGIYAINLTNPAAPIVSNFLNVVTDLGINVGSIGTNVARGLNANRTAPSNDPTSFSAVGKMGIGGMDLSDDNTKLYFTNLFTNTIHQVDITAYNSSGTKPTAANVTTFTIPDPGCTGGTAHAWALKVYRNKVYVGVVCDASTSTKSNLTAFVYQLDPVANTWTNVFTIPLTYPKGYVSSSNPSVTGWFPWNDDLSTFNQGANQFGFDVYHPQPILSDIEFDVDGSMVLGFIDRTGMQTGYFNYGLTGTTLYNGFSGGDILRAYYSNNTFILENNAKAGPSTGYGPANNQGPGFGEFYNDNWNQLDNPNLIFHAENNEGGLALRPGSGEVVTTVMDPINPNDNPDVQNVFYSGGVRHLNNNTGGVNSAYMLYQTNNNGTQPNPGTFGKATGLGDLELACSAATYIELGNRIWNDADHDGVQDPGELPIAGVTVNLYNATTGALVASRTSSASGEYYFSTLLGDALLPNTAYNILFGVGQFNSGTQELTVSANKFKLTVANVGEGSIPDQNDSDADPNVLSTALGARPGGIPQINVTTGDFGFVDHTFDAGVFCSDITATLTPVPATCTATTENNNGQISITSVTNANRFAISLGTSYTGVAYASATAIGSLPQTVVNNAPNEGQTYTVRFFNGSDNCVQDITVTVAPKSCTAVPCGLAMVVTPGLCQSATNSYVLSGTVTATNVPSSGTLTITSAAFSPRSLTLPAGNASGTFSYSGLVSNGQDYTVTASYSNSACSPVSQTFTAPASCSVAPPCSMSAVATPGICATATNAYSATAVVRLTNPTPGLLTVTNGAQSLTFVTTAVSSATFTAVFNGLVSDGQSHTVTASLPGCSTTTATYTAPASCSVAPPCSMSAVATPGICATATNAYSATAVVRLTNPTPGVLTVTNGAQSLTFVTTAVSSATFTALFNGLVSDGASHTVTASLPGCSTTTATYTAPASCSIAPPCSMSAVASPGLCATATNAYSATAVVRLTNPTPGVLTVTNGAQSLTFVTTAVSSATFTAVFNGLVSDGQSHTVTASLPGCSTTTTTYMAPAACSVAPPCSITAVATAGLCATATNAYSATALVRLTNPTPGLLTVTNGAQSLTFVTTAVSSATFTAVFNGLVSDGQSHTVTASLPGCSTTTTTYMAPAACSVAPPCSISAVATAGLCATATNTYAATAVITLTNPTPGLLTVTNGAQSLTFVTTAVSSATFTAVFNGLTSDGVSHTLTASLPGCSTTTTTYTAPAACSIAPPCSMSAVATPGICATATNAYSATALVTLTNPTPGVLTVTNGAQSLTFVTTAVSSATFTALFNGLVSDGASHTVTASLPGCSTTTATYTAPASCLAAPVCSITAVATAGLCATATNTYSATAVITLTNPTPGVLTVTNGAQSLTTTIASGLTSFSFTAVFNGLVSDGQSHTVTASLPGCSTTTTTYTAPASCSIAPVCSITAVATAGLCATATNAYSATALVRLTNPTPGVLTVTNGAQSLTFVTTAVSSATFTAVFNGLTSDGVSHTLTASLPGCSTTTATYTAPAACAIAPVCSITAVATPGICATATNAYSATAVITLTNPTPGVLTVTNGAQSLTTTIASGLTSFSFTAVFNGLVSDGQSHTVMASLPGCSTTTTTYTAPASCSIAPVCSITAVATAGLCATATNAYSATAVITLTNPTPGLLTVTNGAQSLTFVTTAVSSATFTALFNGLTSDGVSHTLTASLPGCSTTTTTYTAPAACSIAPVCSITAVATPGLCATATNAYSATAVITLTNPTPGLLTVTNGAQSLTTTIASGLTSFSFTAAFNGLTSDGQSHTVTASLPGCS